MHGSLEDRYLWHPHPAKVLAGGNNEIGLTLHWGTSSATNRYNLTHGSTKVDPSRADDRWTFVDDEVILDVTLDDFNAYQCGGFAKYSPDLSNPWYITSLFNIQETIVSSSTV
jgi:hypothetical protein